MTGGSGTTQLMSYNTATNKATTNLGYDAAGKVLNDSMHAYTYDADGNLLTVSNVSYSTTYYYDSLNNRVRADGAARGTWEFLFDAAGRRVSTWALEGSTSPIEALVYGDSKLPVALRNSSGTSFEHYNWLGTKRMITTYSGAVEGTIASLPFGDGETLTGTNPDWSDFASLDGDGESNTEHAQFRQYSGNQGRWLSPDPYLGSYDFSNPQTFNRYSYALNDPINNLDPSGLDDCYDGDGDQGCDPGGCLYSDPCGGDSGGDPTDPGNSGNPADPCAGADACVTATPGTPPGTTDPPVGVGLGFGVLSNVVGPSNAPPGMKHCGGSARVLQGNAATIGKPGGFSGSSVGNFPVTANGAAIIPSQFGMSKSALRPFIGQISGVFPNVGASFQGLVDTIGSTTVPNVQSFLMNTYPNLFIVELPGATQDYGTTAVTLTVPNGVGCPTGTVQVP